jgi:putative ABC transport system substrate-binding protein
MRRRDFIALAAGAVVLRPLAAAAQQQAMPVIGVLVIGKPDPTPSLQGFREGLRGLGYIEGRNVRFEFRSAEGDLRRLPSLAAGLVQRKVDVIAALFTPAVLAAKHATSEIPIVIIGAADPVGSGLVASLAHPGGNVTGMAGLVTELAGKHVELLKETMPKLRRIAALCNSADPFSTLFREEIETAGKTLNIEIAAFPVKGGAELDAAFSAMAEKQAEAMIVQPSLPLERVAALALRHRIPAASPLGTFPKLGGLMAYGTAPGDSAARAAVFVDKILKGAKPADLPVEQPTRFRLVINLKTAQALGLEIPAVLLAQADEVIE